MLKIFFINIYGLLYPGATLSLLTPLVFMKFNVLPDVLIEPFSLITPVSDSIVAKRVYRSCPILLTNRITLVYLVELDILEFDVILGMNYYMLVLPPLIVEQR